MNLSSECFQDQQDSSGTFIKFTEVPNQIVTKKCISGLFLTLWISGQTLFAFTSSNQRLPL